MPSKAQIRAEAARLMALFEAQGAAPVEADILQPAGTLLDLYGEDIRARAFVTSDPLRGEMMLRPDFTVPVVQMHMKGGAEPARYTYAGEVFRRQEEDDGRPREYIQVGYEIFDRVDPAQADAEVFARISDALAPLNLRVAIGDIGILRAAVNGLGTTEPRRAALLRHLWRPRRFRALLDRFGGVAPLPAPRRDLLSRLNKEGVDAVMAAAQPQIGLRGAGEIAERLNRLAEDAATAPIDPAAVALIDDILDVRETPEFALERLRDIAVDLPSITQALEGLEQRLEALARRGVALDTLDFEASYGRTALEYYDGFVFGFYAEGRPDLPPVATGGRYDALTRVLGQGSEIPAVGGVIRPGLLLELGGAA